MFVTYFVAVALGAVGYPKTKGLFSKRHIVEAVTYDSMLVQLGRLATAEVLVGSNAKFLLADTYSARNWTSQSLVDLLENLDPIDLIDSNPHLPPWVALSSTHAIGISSKLKPLDDIPWEVLSEPSMVAGMAKTLGAGIAFGLLHRDRAESALEEDRGLYGPTRKYLSGFSVDVLPYDDTSQLREHGSAVIEGYKQYDSTTAVPQDLEAQFAHVSG